MIALSSLLVSSPTKMGKYLDIDIFIWEINHFQNLKIPYFINSTFPMGIILDLALVSQEPNDQTP